MVHVVRDLRDRLREDGVPITESFDEPGFALFKCLDPDGYLIEIIQHDGPRPGEG